MTSTCNVQILKSNEDFHLNEHTVVRTSDESDWQVRLLSSKSLLQQPSRSRNPTPVAVLFKQNLGTFSLGPAADMYIITYKSRILNKPKKTY